MAHPKQRVERAQAAEGGPGTSLLSEGAAGGAVTTGAPAHLPHAAGGRDGPPTSNSTSNPNRWENDPRFENLFIHIDDDGIEYYLEVESIRTLVNVVGKYKHVDEAVDAFDDWFCQQAVFLETASLHDDCKDVWWWDEIRETGSKFEDFADIGAERFILPDMALAQNLSRMIIACSPELSDRLATVARTPLRSIPRNPPITGRQVAWLIYDWFRAKTSEPGPSEVSGRVATHVDGPLPEAGYASTSSKAVGDIDTDNQLASQVVCPPPPFTRGDNDIQSDANQAAKAHLGTSGCGCQRWCDHGVRCKKASCRKCHDPRHQEDVAKRNRERYRRKRAYKKQAKTNLQNASGAPNGGSKEADLGQNDTLDDLFSKSNELLAQDGSSGCQPQLPQHLLHDH